MFDSKFLSGSVAFILSSSRRFLPVAAILSSLGWKILAGHYQEGETGHHSAALLLPSPQVSPFTVNRL